MKTFIKIKSSDDDNPIEMVLKSIMESIGYEVVESSDEATLAIVSDLTVALELLNDSEQVLVLVFCLELNEKREVAGARALGETFPGRVFSYSILGEEDVVSCLKRMRSEA